MKIDSISIKGKVAAFEISEKIFYSDINNKLVGHVLYSQIANSKPRLAKTKQRNQIIGSTAKIHAQKVLETQDMQVKKHHYLLVVVWHTVLKEKFIK